MKLFQKAQESLLLYKTVSKSISYALTVFLNPVGRKWHISLIFVFKFLYISVYFQHENIFKRRICFEIKSRFKKQVKKLSYQAVEELFFHSVS